MKKSELPKSVPRPVELQVVGNTSLQYFHKYLNTQVKKIRKFSFCLCATVLPFESPLGGGSETTAACRDA